MLWGIQWLIIGREGRHYERKCHNSQATTLG
jgi:hypothetical protein